jgi:hypothetical protein
MAETRPGGAGSSSSCRHDRPDRRPDDRPSRPASTRHPLSGHALRGVSALLAGLLLLGGLEIHAAGESHDLVAGVPSHHQDVYFLGASHPVQPPHAETATAVQRPLCAVCLNRLQGNGIHAAPAARLSSPLAAQALPPVVAVSPRRQAPRPDGGRAPPLA